MAREASTGDGKESTERHLGEGDLALYDVTSSCYEGHTCGLAGFGYDRDGQGKPIIVCGVITDREARPVAVRVLNGGSEFFLSVGLLLRMASEAGVDSVVVPRRRTWRGSTAAWSPGGGRDFPGGRRKKALRSGEDGLELHGFEPVSAEPADTGFNTGRCNQRGQPGRRNFRIGVSSELSGGYRLSPSVTSAESRL